MSTNSHLLVRTFLIGPERGRKKGGTSCHNTCQGHLMKRRRQVRKLISRGACVPKPNIFSTLPLKHLIASNVRRSCFGPTPSCSRRIGSKQFMPPQSRAALFWTRGKPCRNLVLGCLRGSRSSALESHVMPVGCYQARCRFHRADWPTAAAPRPRPASGIRRNCQQPRNTQRALLNAGVSELTPSRRDRPD
jgi:hypothetical protein